MTHINDNTPDTYLNVQSVSFIVQQDGSAVFKYASGQLLEFSLTPAIMSKTAITASVLCGACFVQFARYEVESPKQTTS